MNWTNILWKPFGPFITRSSSLILHMICLKTYFKYTIL